MSRFASPALQAISPYVPGEQPKEGQFIKLNTNESPYPPSPRVLSALSREETGKLYLYSDPDHNRLRDALAETFGLSRDRFLVTNGSDEVLAFIFFGLVGKKVLIPEISYGFYPVYCDLFGIEYEKLPLASDLSIDPSLWRGREETIIFANPNAQTGTLLPLEVIEEAVAEDPNRLVVVDEAYIDFGAAAESAIPLTERYDNVIVVRTFSKSRSLAGARVGFSVAAPSLTEDLNKVRNSFNPYNLNRLSLLAAEAALADREYFERTSRAVTLTRETTAARLAEEGFTMTEARGNFLLVGYPGFEGRELYSALRERGILVRFINEPRITDRIRVTVGSPEQMDCFVTEIIDIVKGKTK